MSWIVVLSDQAQKDVEEILYYTYKHFGKKKYNDYLELIRLGIKELAKDPHNIKSKKRSELHPNARTYHLSRRGKNARHFFLFISYKSRWDCGNW